MSIEVMTRVWNNSPHKGNDLLCQISMADNADDDGVCWPGKSYLKRRIRAESKRTVDNVVDRLQVSGELFYRPGKGRGNKSLYLVTTGLTKEQLIDRLMRRFGMPLKDAEIASLSIVDKRCNFQQIKGANFDTKGANCDIEERSDKPQPVKGKRVKTQKTIIKEPSDIEPSDSFFAKVAKSKDYALYIFNEKDKLFCTVSFKMITDVPGGLHDWTSIANAQVTEKRFGEYKLIDTVPSKPDLKPTPPPTPSPTGDGKKPSIDQCVKNAIAKHIQKIDISLSNGLSGTLAQKAAGVWRKHLKTDKLSAEQYEKVSNSIEPFVEWFKDTCKNCDLPIRPETFENRYTQFVNHIIAKAKNPNLAEVGDYVRIPHPDSNLAQLGVMKTVHRSELEAKKT